MRWHRTWYTCSKIHVLLKRFKLLKVYEGATWQPSAEAHTGNNGKTDHEPQFRKSLPSADQVHVEDQPPSWLFVSPAVAGAYGAQVNLDLDLDTRLSGDSLKALEVNVESRGSSVDIKSLLKDFNALKKVQKEKANLLLTKEDLLQQLRELKQHEKTKDLESSKKQLAAQLKDVKAEISLNLKSSWDLEEKVILEALKLPNDLHPSSLLENPKLLKEGVSQTELMKVPSHVEIAKKFDLIKFSNVGPKAYFLKEDLALAEMALTSTVCDYLESSRYRHMSGPEFVKTPIIEGCGGDVRDGKQILTMIDPHKKVVEPMNHLTGVSLNSFAAYVARTCVSDSVLPLQMFSCGRSYQQSDLPGLFGAIQMTKACHFSCVTEKQVDDQFDRSVALVWEFLSQLGFQLRLVQVPAKSLRREEKRRVNAEMFSPNLRKFLQVASVSDVGDFVSRRLMVMHNQNHADIRSAQRLYMIHGTVVDITSLLALWMEHSYTDDTTFSLLRLPQVQGCFNLLKTSS